MVHFIQKKRKLRKTFRHIKQGFYGVLLACTTLCVAYGLYYNYPGYLYNKAHNLFINFTAYYGFTEKILNIEGNKEISDDMIVKTLNYKRSLPLCVYNTKIMKNHIEELLQVKLVSVKKRYPHSIDIHIVERQPIAQWLDKGKYHLVDDTGIAYKTVRQKQSELPLIEGSGSPQSFSKFFTLMAQYPEIKAKALTFQLIQNRRWNLMLDNNCTIYLPQNNIEKALNTLNKMQNLENKVVDLRTPGYVFLRNKKDKV